jgi:hypothetical protein
MIASQGLRQGQMVVLIPNSPDEGFLAQVDILGQIFHYGGDVAVNVNDDGKNSFKQRRDYDKVILCLHYCSTSQQICWRS